MTDFNNTVLIRLIKEFGFKEGQYEDFYFQARDERKTKPILTKRAAMAIKEARGFVHDTPTVQLCETLVVVHGWWHYEAAGKDTRSVWTTGAGKPGAKAVEGGHPLAMAEKRWKVRGILLLECGEGSGIISEDELADEDRTQIRKGAQKPGPAKQPDPPKVHEHDEWWKGAVAAIVESTGATWASIEGPLLDHCSLRQKGDKWYSAGQFKLLSFAALREKSPDWGLWTVKQAFAVRDALKGGSPVEIDFMDHTAKDPRPEPRTTLRPTASANSGDGEGGEAASIG